MAGWNVNAKRVQRIWRAEGLKVPKRQPKRGRLWLTDGSCIRLRPEHANHVWAYDFVSERTHDGRPLKLLTVVDEYTRECLAIRVERRITANDVLWALADLFLEYGIPEHIRSDNGPEFVATAVRQLARRARRHDPVHRARQPLGERLRRVVQRQAARRALERRDLLHAQGGADPGRRLAAPLQRPAAAQLAGQRPPAPETIVWPGFALTDFAPPSPTPEVALGLT